MLITSFTIRLLITTTAISTGMNFAVGQTDDPSATTAQHDPTEQSAAARSTIHSTHFAIEFDTPPAVAQALLTRAEATFAAVIAFCSRLGIPVHSPVALRIILHNDRARYERNRLRAGLQGVGVMGYYRHDGNTVVLLDVSRHPTVQRINELLKRMHEKSERGASDVDGEKASATGLERLRAERDVLVERINRLVVQHEVAHQVFFNIGVFSRADPAPDWLNEGLACMFETSLGNAKQEKLPLNEMRLADLCTAMAGGEALAPSSDGAAAARETDTLIPARLLIGPGAFEASDARVQALRYAQSWALVDYLIQRFPNSFAEFLVCTSRRDRDHPDPQPADRGPCRSHALDAFERHFGVADKAFDLAWAEFVRGYCRDLRPSTDAH